MDAGCKDELGLKITTRKCHPLCFVCREDGERKLMGTVLIDFIFIILGSIFIGMDSNINATTAIGIFLITIALYNSH